MKGQADELRQAAIAYAKAGYPIFPVKPHDKIPSTIHGFKDATTNLAQIENWWTQTPSANIGLPTGAISGLFVLDIDAKNNGQETLAQLEKKHGSLPITPRASTGGGGTHVCLKYPGFHIKSTVGIAPGIDIRGDGGYIVVPPSIHSSGNQYTWKVSLLEMPLAEPPQWVLDLVSTPKPKPKTPGLGPDLFCEGERNAKLTSMAGKLKNQGLSSEELFDSLLAINQTRCIPPLPECELEAIVGSSEDWDGPPSAILMPQTDAGNAEYFASLYQDCLCYDHKHSRWMVWRGNWWEKDRTQEVWQRAKEAARIRQKHATLIHGEKAQHAFLNWTKCSENRSKIEACLQIATTQAPLANPGTRWDTEPMLLGVSNGVIDLTTGQFRPGIPKDSITLHANVAYDPKAKCPRWEQFVEEIFLGNAGLCSYVKRAVGYSLTGLTDEHVLFLCHGHGANGKSVLLRVLCDVLGGYTNVTPFTTLDAMNKSAIPNDIAALEGCRLVWASEAAHSAVLNEEKVKQLVHADKVSVRFLYREFFQFVPVAKFWLTVNQRPEVRDSSYGFWRSVHVIPFEAQFTGAKADPQLIEKLKAEAPGILLWAIQGCLEWQKTKLAPPVEVLNATEDYQADNDVLADFIEGCCELGPDKSVYAAPLYRHYRRHAERNLLPERDILGTRKFGEVMAAKFHRKSKAEGRMYCGIDIKNVFDVTEV